MTLFNSILPFTGRSRARGCSGVDCETTEATVRPQYSVTPASDASGWMLKVSLPDVTKAGLSLTDEAGVLTIRGERAWKRPDGWTVLYRESMDAPYSLALEHDNEIDVEKIKADFTDGILTVTLPKAESLKPRKIEVN